MFYFLLFLLPFLASLISIPFLIKIANRYQLFDVAQGDVLKIHKKPTSIFGGLAIIIAMIIGLVFFSFQQQEFTSKIQGIILASLIIFLLGFWDDLKWKHISQIKTSQKFILLISLPLVATLVLLISGIQIGFFSEIYLAGFLLLFYIFVFMNAVNYQDGMDGLAGGLTAISLIGFIILALTLGNNFALILALILLGGVLGFMVFNFPPAKIFMGDSGAYFLGFILAVLALSFSQDFDFLSIIGPVFIIGMPLFDGAFTNIRRLLKGKSIFFGDRSHFYDQLLQKGFSTKKTLLIAYSFQIISVIIGLAFFVIDK